jgi:beta-glucosidase
MSNFLKFPDGFLWGAASASYQVEGGIYNNDWAKATKESGKVPPANESGDHYNKYESDFDIAKSLGQNCQRISIEWSRIEPEQGRFDQNEINHYRKVIQAMNECGLKPFVTLWHFTLPTWFSDKGGFEQKDAPETFSKYCSFVVGQLDDLCVNFSTMNEPLVWLSQGYWRGGWPPFKKRKLFKTIKVFNNLVRAHNLSYKKIKAQNKNLDINFVKHNISLVSNWTPWSKIAKFFSFIVWNRLFIYKTIKNTDSIGINYYFHRQLFKFGVKKYPKSDMGWDLNPDGLYNVLRNLKRFNKPVYVTEAGLADEKDKYRADYIRGLVKSVHKAIEEGVDIRGFMYWSIIDNFEWAEGFWPRFGLVEIDYESPEKTRTIRQSAYVYKDICENNGLKLK